MRSSENRRRFWFAGWVLTVAIALVGCRDVAPESRAPADAAREKSGSPSEECCVDVFDAALSLGDALLVLSLVQSGEPAPGDARAILDQIRFLDRVGAGLDAVDRQIELLEHARDADPRDAELAETLAWRYLSAKRLREANTAFRDLIVSQELSATACEGLAETLRGWDDPDEIDEAWIMCANHSQSPAEVAEYWMRAGVVRRDHGKFPEAIEAFQVARAAVGDSSELSIGIGITYELSGDISGATAWYRKAAERFDAGPSDRAGKLALARLALRQDKPELARKILTSAKPIAGKAEEELIHLVGASFGRQHDLQGLKQYCENQGSQFAGLMYAWFEWRARRDRDVTEKTLSALNRSERPSVRARNLEVKLWLELRDLETAERLLAGTTAVLNPETADLWVEIWFQKGEITRAKEFADTAIRRVPYVAIYWEQLARVQIASGRFYRARRTLEYAGHALYPVDAGNSDAWWIQKAKFLLLESQLVGHAGSAIHDERLSAELELLTHRLHFNAELWHALAMVRQHLGHGASARSAQQTAASIAPHRYNPWSDAVAEEPPAPLTSRRQQI